MFSVEMSKFEECSATHGGNVYLSGYEFNLIITKQKFEGVDISNDNLFYGRDESISEEGEKSLIPFILNKIIYVNNNNEIKNTLECGSLITPCKFV
jgi:hypothetical protein